VDALGSATAPGKRNGALLSSLRSISRVCNVSIKTVTKLLIDAGRVSAAFHDEKVEGVKAKRVPCDEIWIALIAVTARSAGDRQAS
jgi:hypothetical protein